MWVLWKFWEAIAAAAAEGRERNSDKKREVGAILFIIIWFSECRGVSVDQCYCCGRREIINTGNTWINSSSRGATNIKSWAAEPAPPFPWINNKTLSLGIIWITDSYCCWYTAPWPPSCSRSAINKKEPLPGRRLLKLLLGEFETLFLFADFIDSLFLSH